MEKVFGGSFIRDWRRFIDNKSAQTSKKLPKEIRAIREMITEITDLRVALKGVLPFVNNRRPMCSAECLGKCEACMAIEAARKSLGI